jgi:tRNA uridine 5-carboxymethylaminomethyl modification enzyme
MQDFDVIVVGGGHAGIEAAYAAARLGSKTLLLTLSRDRIGYMPCNPAIGGVGKGHIVFEISALGGLMPKLCTQTYLQARMLNTKKGPAVQGLRLQIDKHAYNNLSRQWLEQTDNLTIIEGKVASVLVDEQRIVRGIITETDQTYHAPCVVLTTGTFLNGLIHVGKQKHAAGRQGDDTVIHLSEFLHNLGLEMGRLKTGTPPRLLRSSLDFSKMTLQEPDNLHHLFEFYPHTVEQKMPCYITHTTEQTHAIIRNNLHQAPMYNGSIKSIGPRYCPSVEDKIARFPEKTSHHVFVEPESASSDEIYPNGISTSLPLEVQHQFVRTIPGFQEAIIVRAGYAVEYDFVLPHQLHHTLELKSINGLFLAGQINGTTGYEEAAGQGIIAGINAHLKSNNLPPFILERTQAYIGVMIDDLVSLSVDEPYRMFTSRAERRLMLRQDNVFQRLADVSFNVGLIDQKLYNAIQEENNLVAQVIQDLRAGNNNCSIIELLGNQDSHKQKLAEATNGKLSERTLETVWANIRYEPYLAREQREIEKFEQYRQLKIPEHFDFAQIPGLSTELKQKLTRHRPSTIAQAMLIPGITPAAISLLIFKVRQGSKKLKTESNFHAL